MGELLKILTITWVSKQVAENSHQRQLITLLLHFYTYLYPFYRSHNCQIFTHRFSTFTPISLLLGVFYYYLMQCIKGNVPRNIIGGRRGLRLVDYANVPASLMQFLTNQPTEQTTRSHTHQGRRSKVALLRAIWDGGHTRFEYDAS